MKKSFVASFMSLSGGLSKDDVGFGVSPVLNSSFISCGCVILGKFFNSPVPLPSSVKWE